MSTRLLIGRWPASARRTRIQKGAGCTVTAESGGEFARQAQDRHRIDAIGRHLDVEHVVAEAKGLDEIATDFESVIELQDAVFEPLRFEAQLVRGDEHAFRIDAAHLARTDREAGQLRAERGDRHDLPWRHVGRRGRDRERSCAADVDRADE